MTAEQSDLDRYIREELPRFLEIVTRSKVRELEISEGEVSLKLRRGERLLPADEGGIAAVIAESEEGPALGNIRIISSPMVGRFYQSEQPGGAPLITEGSRLERGTVIGVVEALQVQTEVESDLIGTVRHVLVGDGQAVEYGQPLVEVVLDG